MTETEKRSKVIEIAEFEAKALVKENPNGSNKVKYNEWIYGKSVVGPSYPWCAAFVSWCFDKAGINLGRIDVVKGFVGCPFAVKALSDNKNPAKIWGKIVTKEEVKPGDVVFFDWNADKKYDHVGIFFGHNVDGKRFSAIEGNTGFPKSDDPTEVHQANSNGGAVIKRDDRNYSQALFVRPNVYNL